MGTLQKIKRLILLGLCGVLTVWTVSCAPSADDTPLAPLAAPTNTPGPAVGAAATASVSPSELPSATPLVTAGPTLTPLPPSRCPSPGSATLPSTPPPFNEYAATIQDYLSGGGSIDGLAATLAAWGGLNGETGAVQANYDYTGDTVPEVVVAVQAPLEQFDSVLFPPGDLYVYSCSEGAYILLYADFSTPDRPTPQIISANLDLNGTGLTDLFYTTTYCGAHTCTPHVTLIEWDPVSLVFRNLATNIADMASGEVSIADQDGNGVYDVVVSGGLIGSVGAGPQRSSLDTYVWNGSSYVLGSREYTTPQSEWYPIHYLSDADAAVEAGNTAAAIPLYQRVIDDPNPKTWRTSTPTGEAYTPEEEIRALRAYARYRLIVAYVLTGDQTAAQTTYEQLSRDYTPEVVGASFARMANLFWQEYRASGNVTAACSAATDWAAQNPNAFWILNQFGYANLHDSTDLCVAER